MTPVAPPVVVVGAGLGGLAAAVRLAEAGVPVLVLEQRARGGGRAASYRDAASGETIDNGQHLLIAGYTRTMAFLETVGSGNLVKVQPSPSILFHHPDRGFLPFALPRLPSPLHLLAGVFASPLLPFRDRPSFLAAGVDLWRRDPEVDEELAGMTVDEWLDSVDQSREARHSFWEPLAVAIMNERTSVASALPLVHALREAFLRHRSGAAAVLPRVGLTELFAEPAARYIRSRGGSLRFGAVAERVSVRDGAAAGVTLRSGEEVAASAVILAVPPHALLPLLPAALAHDRLPARLEELRWSPIVSMHLWYGEDFMPHDMVGVLGRTIQWAFNRRMIASEGGAGGHVSVTVSAAHGVVDLDNEELARRAAEDLASLYGSRATAPIRAVVIRERRATYSSTPAAERLRPDQRTAVPRLLLAGDWTATGLPATIEGAIRSGEACARLAAGGS